MNMAEALEKHKHVGRVHDGGWANREMEKIGNKVLINSVVNKYLAEEGLRIVAQHADYDSGFEAGVLATEAGLGRYDG